MKKILYIYDIDNWALHNIGLHWEKLLKDDFFFDYIKLENKNKYFPENYDYIIDACTLFQERHLLLRNLLSKIGIMNLQNWDPSKNKNIISIVHDPCEVFPQIENWKEAKPYLRRVKKYSRIGVISNEMQTILKENGIDSIKINTTTTLQIKNDKDLLTEKIKVFTKANPAPRKNLILFEKLKKTAGSFCDAFDGYYGSKALPSSEYIDLIDKYNCYICTSWQEGGPIPLMDAMARGCAILTTPVGQTDELVLEGENGFFCKTSEDFLARLNQLANDEDLLLKMRKKSIEIISNRNGKLIKKQLLSFLR